MRQTKMCQTDVAIDKCGYESGFTMKNQQYSKGLDFDPTVLSQEDNEELFFDKPERGHTDIDAYKCTGKVLKVLKDSFIINTGNGTINASQAFSCLVVPEEGDLVLLARTETANIYILSILERTADCDTRITTEGNFFLDLRKGSFSVAATNGVNIFTQKSAIVTANKIVASSAEANFIFSNVKLIANTVNSTLERISQTVKRYYRRIEELEYVRAGQIDYESKGNTRIHGENTLLTAKELVKADAKQIHMG